MFAKLAVLPCALPEPDDFLAIFFAVDSYGLMAERLLLSAILNGTYLPSTSFWNFIFDIALLRPLPALACSTDCDGSAVPKLMFGLASGESDDRLFIWVK